jgi:hypothetical protein
MTAQRIPDLTVQTAAATANDDYFIIYDSSTNLTKKIAKSEVSSFAATDLTAAAVLSKLLTVDGAGSGLDADTLDGVQLAALAQLAGAAFTGNVSVAGSFTHSGVQASFNKISVGEIRGAVTESDADDTSRTLVAADSGTQIFNINNMTVPANVFSNGHWIVVHGTDTLGTGGRVTRGSGVTMYFEGTNVAEVFLDLWSSAVIIFDSATVCRVVARGSTSPPP